MTQAFLQEQFRARIQELPGTETMRVARQKAMLSFNSSGYPTRKWEDWRYTDLKTISSAEYDPIPALPSANTISHAKQQVDSLGLAKDAKSIVFIDGYLKNSFGPLPATHEIEIANLYETAEHSIRSSTSAFYEGMPLAALNTAFSAGGIYLQVAADTIITAPLHLIFVASNEPSITQQPRVVINLKPGSQLQVIQHFIGSTPSISWTNAVTQITQEAGSTLRLYRIQDESETQLHTELLSSKLAADANLELGYVDFGGSLVRNDARIDLAGPGASCNLFGLSIANNGQHVDNHIHINHIEPRTVSQQAFRSIIGDQGRGVFNGKVVVQKNAQKIDAQQSSDNLLLSERSEINTKPELEIYADDVKCTHGATVGQLDEEQLFYLRARGVDETAARGLLTFAFANQIINRLQIPELKERVMREILQRLPGRQQWDELL